MIHLADDLQIDLSRAAGRRFTTIGKSGFGKTNTLCRIAEGTLAGNMPTVFIDPLRQFTYLANLYPVIVAGRTKRAHLEITPANAAGLARLVLAERVSLILDTSRYEPDEEMDVIENFLRPFWNGLLMQDEDAVQPFAVIVDELQQFAPEGGSVPTKKILVDMAKRGRHMRLLLATATQRGAAVTKEMLSQTSLLIAHHLMGSADSDRVAELLNMKRSEVTPLMRGLRKGAALVVGDNDLTNDADYLLTQILKSQKPDQLTDAPLPEVQPRPLDADLLKLLEALQAAPAAAADASAAPDDATRQQLSEAFLQIDLQKREIERLGRVLGEKELEIHWLQGALKKAQRISALASMEPATMLVTDNGFQDEDTVQPHDFVFSDKAKQRQVERQAKAVRRQNRAFTELLLKFKELTQLEREVAAYLLDHAGQLIYPEQIALGLGLSGDRVRKHPPFNLLELGLIERKQHEGRYAYQENIALLKTRFTELDVDRLVEQLIEAGETR